MPLWYDETFEDESRFGLRVSKILFARQSQYQFVEVLETPQHGLTLVIDGIFMTSEHDEHFYHEMLVHPAMVTAPAAKRVLVIGGGDGASVRTILMHPGVERVVMVEIDACVVEACKEYMPSLGAWDDPRLELIIGDGIDYVKHAEVEPFDVVFLDGTDPVGPGKGLFDREFFLGAKRLLAPGGVFAMQSESPILTNRLFLEIVETLRSTFRRADPYFGPVPLYAAGIWSWLYASDSADPMAIDEARLARIEEGCKYYNAEIHRASFVLPNRLRRQLAELKAR